MYSIQVFYLIFNVLSSRETLHDDIFGNLITDLGPFPTIKGHSLLPLLQKDACLSSFYNGMVCGPDL